MGDNSSIEYHLLLAMLGCHHVADVKDLVSVPSLTNDWGVCSDTTQLTAVQANSLDAVNGRC
jgi:hypothetical protein